MCDVTKTPHYARSNFVYSELLCICKRDVPIWFNEKNNNVVLE